MEIVISPYERNLIIDHLVVRWVGQWSLMLGSMSPLPPGLDLMKNLMKAASYVKIELRLADAPKVVLGNHLGRRRPVLVDSGAPLCSVHWQG